MMSGSRLQLPAVRDWIFIAVIVASVLQKFDPHLDSLDLLSACR